MLCLIWITDKKREFVAIIYLQGASCTWRKTVWRFILNPLVPPGMRFLKEVVSLMMCIVATCFLVEAYCPLAGSSDLWKIGID